MSHNSKNRRIKLKKREFKDLHLSGGKGPTPKGGPFPYAGCYIHIPKHLRAAKRKSAV